jgi:hypothetical protein
VWITTAGSNKNRHRCTWQVPTWRRHYEYFAATG